MQKVQFQEEPRELNELCTSRGIIVQRISTEKYASLVTPCREEYGVGVDGTFTCLEPNANHAHLIIADDGIGIVRACIFSREYFADVLHALTHKYFLTKAEAALLLERESHRLEEKLNIKERTVLDSPKLREEATKVIYIVLDPPD